MPRCEGHNEGACPDRRNDDGVKLSQGDLMLCEDCDRYRFPSAYSTSSNLRLAKAKNVKQSSARDKQVTRDETVVKTAAWTDSMSSDSAIGGSDESPKPTETKHVILNEVLAYVSYYRDRSTKTALMHVVLSSFSSSEISAPKKCLINKFHLQLSDTAFLTERRDSTARIASEAGMDNITGIMTHLDSKDYLRSVIFAASDFGHFPGYTPEETNICAIADWQWQLSSTVDQLADTVSHLLAQPLTTLPVSTIEQVHIDELSNRVNTLLNTDTSATLMRRTDDQFAVMTSKLQDQLNVFTDTCTQAAMSVSNTVASGNNASHAVDRSRNIIITGVGENHDSDVWNYIVLRAVTKAAGRTVNIDDAFRLGRFHQQKIRPTLVKLKSVWNRRLVPNGAHKLKNDDELRRVYINPDEPLESRR